MVELPLDDLEQWLSAETLRKGRLILDGGRVTVASVEGRDDLATQVVAAVQGTAREPYRVSLRLIASPDGHELDGSCTCPVGDRCKHLAAVALSLVAPDGSGRDVPAWERRLGEVLGQLEARAGAAGDLVPLALQFEHRVVSMHWSEPRDTLPFHPMRRGKKGAWIKSGASWHDMQYGMGHRHEHDPAQVEVLQSMAAAFKAGFGQTPDLTRLRPMVWPLLRQAVEAGIELIPGHGLVGVRLSDPVDVEGDLHAEDDGSVSLALRLTGDAETVSTEGASVSTIGDPAHGLVVLRSAPAPGPRRTPHFALTLAPLAHPLPPSAQRLLTRREPLVIPAADRATFERDYLPRLRRQLPTGSRDGTLTLPEIEPPRLVLTVTWPTLGAARTSWSWRYRTGASSRTYGLASTEGLRDVRDREAETRLLEAAGSLDALDVGELREEDGRLVAERDWHGLELLDLSEHILPTLRKASADGAFDLEEGDDRPDYRAADHAPEVSFGIADSEQNDWLDLAVTIAIGAEQIPLKRILTALTHGDAVIFTDSGQHVPTDHPAFAQLAELVAAAGQIVDQPGEGLRVGRHDLSMWAELADLGVVDEQAEQWVASARALRDFVGLPEVPLDGVSSTLRPYQYDGVRWLAFLWRSGLGGILADDMGLGKTLQTLALINHARAEGAGPFLVVAPTSVVGNWVHEVAEHTGMTVRAVTASGAKRESSIDELFDEADIVVTSYTLFRLEADAYVGLGWGGLVLDEAQQVKNHQGKTYHAVRRLDVPFRLALTGTPFENRLMELWALLSIVAPGLYPWPRKFAELVAKPAETRGDQVALDRFRRRIRPFVLRRTKELVARDLPPKQEQVLDVTLGTRHRAIYDTHLQRERQAILGLVDDFARNRVAIFGALTRLRQLSLDPALVDERHEKVGSAKIDLLVEQLTELAAEGHRALVFSQFTSFLGRVRSRLDAAGIGSVYLDGRTRNRPEVIDRFKSGTDPVFLISLKAGGTGLTLTEADYVFVLDPWWNPATEAQAVDRAHRIGQTRHVMVYRLVAADTIEEKVMELKARKAALFAQVVDGGGALSGDLTADDVRALFD